MPPIVRNILAVIIGSAVCLLLNGIILGQMMKAIPPPEGFEQDDFSTYALLQGKHLLGPFLAHAVPSLLGGLLAALIAASRKITFALVVGALHLVGGIAAVIMLPAPIWFEALDLVVAYLPMAWIGGKLGAGVGRAK